MIIPVTKIDVENHIGRRIVLTCNNNMSYAGILKKIITEEEIKASLLVELHEESGFSILCPIDYVQFITVIPINE